MAEQLPNLVVTPRCPYIISNVCSYLSQKILQIQVNRVKCKCFPLIVASVHIDCPVFMDIAINIMTKFIAFIALTNNY